MNFQKKNFRYVKKPFGAFIDEISAGAKQYLRSLAADRPADKPASFETDYAEIARDFELPQELSIVSQNAHSSVLRISGPVIMWLHYDVWFSYDLHTERAHITWYRSWPISFVRSQAPRNSYYTLLPTSHFYNCHPVLQALRLTSSTPNPHPSLLVLTLTRLI